MQLIFFCQFLDFSILKAPNHKRLWLRSKLLVYLCWSLLFMPCNFLKLLLVYFLALFSPCCLVSRIKEPFDPCWLFRMTEAVVIQSKISKKFTQNMIHKSTGSPQLVRFLGGRQNCTDLISLVIKIIKWLFLDNYACFQNHTLAKSALIETALSGYSLYEQKNCLSVIKSKIFARLW